MQSQRARAYIWRLARNAGLAQVAPLADLLPTVGGSVRAVTSSSDVLTAPAPRGAVAVQQCAGVWQRLRRDGPPVWSRGRDAELPPGRLLLAAVVHSTRPVLSVVISVASPQQRAAHGSEPVVVAWVAGLQRQCLVFPAGSPDDGVVVLSIMRRGADTLGRAVKPQSGGASPIPLASPFRLR